tara:strand:- start:748 stop:1602 length:855 start_codon:yes stop_codon:yes gene_type:complete
MEKITQLLYRKKMIENSLSKAGKGADVYSALHDILAEELTSGKKLTKLQRARMEAEIIEVRLQAQNFINSFKESKREYNHYLIPEIETVVKEMDEVPEISFEDYEDEANNLAIREIYGVTTKKPDNVEHIDIIQDFKKNISLTENLITASVKALKGCKDDLEKARLEKDIFKGNLEIGNLKKRLNAREEYYNKQFLPKFKTDMVEADERLEQMLEIGHKMVKFGIDPKLTFMLQQYESHKEDEEKTWLFYTALKSRLKSIAKAMRKDPSGFKGNMSLADKKLYI